MRDASIGSRTPKNQAPLTQVRHLLRIACAVLIASIAVAQTESIRFYHSDIKVQDDGTMLVRETIRVVSTGNRIRHGIYRDFPSRYTDRLGNRYVVGFALVAASRDGAPEESRVENYGNGVRIYLGRNNSIVSPGEHTYSITYTTNRQLGFFEDHDELFWNVTGNGWIFPIDHASAIVTLPPKLSRSEVHVGGYTGPNGSVAQDFTSRPVFANSFLFNSAHPLGPREGLTILLEWPKGYFSPPTTGQTLRYFAHDNMDAMIATGGLLLILLYYVLVWMRVGRGPSAGTIMPLYEPPPGFSPSAMRYLVRMGYDDKAFTAAVLDMAVKGFLKIDEGSGLYTLSRTQADGQTLTPEERAAGNKLFEDGREQIDLKNENHVAISAAMAALKAWLKTAEQKIYFVTNSRYMIPAIVFSVVMLLAIVAAKGQDKMAMAGFMCVWLSGWSIAVYGMLQNIAHLWKSAWVGGHLKAGLAASATSRTLFSIPFLLGEILGLVLLTVATSVFITVVLVMTVILHVIFHQLLKAPTSADRGVLDKIEGFKMFLGAVDGDRMNRVTPPDQTPAVFEKYLPCAPALDVEQAWEKSSLECSAGRRETQGSNSAGYSPAWYAGSDFGALGAAGFASSPKDHSLAPFLPPHRRPDQAAVAGAANPVAAVGAEGAAAGSAAIRREPAHAANPSL